MLTCTFFGHKDTSTEIEPILKKILIDLIENKNICNFYVGNHGNFDHIVKHVLSELSETYPITYLVVLAYHPSKQDKFETEYYDKTILPNGIEMVPQRFAVSYRNRWMIEQSDYVITFVRHSFGSAAKFKEFAEKKNKIIINITI